jgi:hypothetical protein
MLCAVGEPNLLKQGERTTTPLAMVHTRSDERDLDVRPRRERVQEQVTLEDESDDFAAGTGGPGLLPDSAPVDEDLP